MPGFNYKNSIQKKIYFPKILFVSDWKLFTPPSTYVQRLYYIVKDVKKTSLADTIEIMENISVQKQLKAPFNQEELIIDYMVNKNVIRLSKIGWVIYTKSTIDSLGLVTSGKSPQSTETAANSKNLNTYLSSLINFGGMVLKERNINIDGKEVKIVIKQKKITPFKEMCNTNFVRTETTVFESPYMPFQ